jgi:hypothetical protein
MLAAQLQLGSRSVSLGGAEKFGEKQRIFQRISLSLLTEAFGDSNIRTNFADAHIVQFRRGIAQSGSAPALGAGCREFESLYPDHFLDRASAF